MNKKNNIDAENDILKKISAAKKSNKNIIVNNDITIQNSEKITLKGQLK
jgi:hypothetical protein